MRLHGYPASGRSMRVRLEPHAIIAIPDAVAERALAAARRGKVLVVRNLVHDAIAVARALQKLDPDPAHRVGSCRGHLGIIAC